MSTQQKPRDKSKSRADTGRQKDLSKVERKGAAKIEAEPLTVWLRHCDLRQIQGVKKSPQKNAGKKDLAFKQLSWTSERLQELSWGTNALRLPKFEKLLTKLQLIVEQSAGDEAPVVGDVSDLEWLFYGEAPPILTPETLLGSVAIATCWPYLVGLLDDEFLEHLRHGWIDTLELAARLPAEDVDMVSWLIAHVELPLILATWVNNKKSAKSWSALAAQSLHETVVAGGEDASAWVQSGGRRLRASMASCLRSLSWCELHELNVVDTEFKKAFGVLLAETLRWTRKDGSVLLSPNQGSSGTSFDGFWPRAFRIAGKPKQLGLLLKERLPKQAAVGITAAASTSSGKITLEPTSYWSTGEAGVMQREWDSQGTRVAVDYSVDPLLLEIVGLKGESLIAGPWSCSVSKNGEPLTITSSWQEVCWFSENDLDYLELEASCDEICRIQRQVLLIRKSGIVLIADALLGSEAAMWRICSTLPLAGPLELEQAEKTRECWLTIDQKRRALVVPLASGEWRRQLSPHQIQVDDGLLCIEHQAEAKNLYAPVAFALRREHLDAPLTWRPLTVVENLKLQPPEVASAFRLQLEREQWLFYRSLEPAVPRSFLGCHTNSDFCAGVFDFRTGDIDSLVEVSGTGDDEESADSAK